jgi:hypothetical protein
LRRYVDTKPWVSLVLFWFVVPAMILIIAIVTQVQFQNQQNRTEALAKSVDERVNMILCNLTQGAWLERGRIIDGLVLATIRFVERNPLPGDAEFIAQFQKYHAQLQKELHLVNSACKQG